MDERKWWWMLEEMEAGADASSESRKHVTSVMLAGTLASLERQRAQLVVIPRRLKKDLRFVLSARLARTWQQTKCAVDVLVVSSACLAATRAQNVRVVSSVTESTKQVAILVVLVHLVKEMDSRQKRVAVKTVHQATI